MKTDGEHALVVIPTYNRAKVLPEAVGSVLAQDYPFVKIVIVDDGSEDNTQEVCLPFVQTHPDSVFYCRKPNGGCASARNYGLAYLDASVGYVCFLDSDDQMLEAKLSIEINTLRKSPAADFCYSDYILYEEKTGKNTLVKPAAAGNPDCFAIEHFLTNNAKPGAVLYRAHVFKTKKFDEGFRYNEDSEFLQRVAIEHSGVYSEKPSCWVRIHPEGKSRNRPEICQAVLHAYHKTMVSYPDFYHKYRELINRRVQKIRSDLFAELAMRGRYREAEPYATGIRKRILFCLKLGIYYRLKHRLEHFYHDGGHW